MNLDTGRAGLKRLLDLNELEELRNDAYFNSKIAKDKLKKWHDQLITYKNFNQVDQVLLYNSKLHLFSGKLKSRWIGPFIVQQAYPNGLVDLLNPNDNRVFIVNGQIVKPYIRQVDYRQGGNSPFGPSLRPAGYTIRSGSYSVSKATNSIA